MIKNNEMKFNLYTELLNEKDILSHVFLGSLPNELSLKIASRTDEIAKEIRETHKDLEEDEREKLVREETNKREIDMSLTIEGVEVDPRRFFHTMWENYERIIKAEATEMLQAQTTEAISELTDQLYDLRTKIEGISESVEWDWKMNPFQKPKEFNFATDTVRFLDTDCSLKINKYIGNKAISIQLWSPNEGPIAWATVNVPTVKIESDDVIIKNYSENEGILKALVKAGVVLNPHRKVQVGKAEGSVCKLIMKLPDNF